MKPLEDYLGWLVVGPAVRTIAGIACARLIAPLADAQRALSGEEVMGGHGTLVSPECQLVYDGFFYLLDAARESPDLVCPEGLVPAASRGIDDLMCFSRRELPLSRQYSMRTAALGAALLLARSTGRRSIDVPQPTLETIAKIVDKELALTGGDAFLQTGRLAKTSHG